MWKPNIGWANTAMSIYRQWDIGWIFLFGAGFQGQDVVTLFVAVPALLFASWWAWSHGGVHWMVLRLGLVTFFAYVYGSMALGAFYNELFLVYVAALSAGLVALVLSARELHTRLSPKWAILALSLPRAGPAFLLLVCGVFTGFIWTQPLIGALLSGTSPPLLFHATTKVTEVLDLAIVAPSAIISAWLVWRRHLIGYVMAVSLLSLIVMLCPTITASTISQLRAGITFAPPEVIGPIAGFLIFGAWGAWLLFRLVVQLRAAESNRPT